MKNFLVCVHALPKCLPVIHIFNLVKIYSKATTIGPTARLTEKRVFPVSYNPLANAVYSTAF